MSVFKKISSVKWLVFTNTLTILFLLVIVLREGYPQRLLGKVKSHFSKEQASDLPLQKMNNTIMPTYIDTTYGNSTKDYKILIIGNSLARHEVAAEIGWTHVSGMAATTLNKDYAHIIFNQLREELPGEKISMRISNFAKFERNPQFLDTVLLDTLAGFQPDLIIFQLGENVTLADTGSFKGKYVELIEFFKKRNNATTICTTPFFPSVEKNNVISKVAIATKSFLVDLSHLPLLNDENYAKSEKNYKGDKTVWKNDGIGIHPGDQGMEEIAEQLLITINAAMAELQ